jgi:hypothetical protein
MLTGTTPVLLAAAAGVALVVVAGGVTLTPDRSGRCGGCCHTRWLSGDDARNGAFGWANRVSAGRAWASEGGLWAPDCRRNPRVHLHPCSETALGHGVGHLLVGRCDAEVASVCGTVWFAGAEVLEGPGPHRHAVHRVLLPVWPGTVWHATVTPMGMWSPQGVRMWPCSAPTAGSCRAAAPIVPGMSMTGLAHVRRVASRFGDAAAVSGGPHIAERTTHAAYP